jgi:hypothetical protein
MQQLNDISAMVSGLGIVDFQGSKPERSCSPIHPVSLRFRDEVLDSAYCLHHASAAIRVIRFSMILAAVLYLLFAVLDFYLIPQSAERILWIRVAGTIFFSGVALLAGTRIWMRYYDYILMLTVVAGGVGIMVMILLTVSNEGNNYYAGLILTVMFAHGLMRMHFLSATISTWFIIMVYTLLLLITSSVPVHYILNNLFFLISANVMGMFTSYGLEYYMRTEFWRALNEQAKGSELKFEHDRKSRELESARRMQLAMLPAKLPDYEGYTFEMHMQTAAEIGGDFYDFTTSDSGDLIFTIGDATGHGAQAGAMVSALKLLFSDYALKTGLVEFLQRASLSIRKMGLKTLFMAAAIGRLSDNVVELAGAGMPPALLYRSESRQVERIQLKGMPLGGAPNYPYTLIRFEMHPGDVLLLMSDGLPECFNPDRNMLGLDRIAGLFGSLARQGPGEVIDGLKNAVLEWSGRPVPEDDLSVMVLQRKV